MPLRAVRPRQQQRAEEKVRLVYNGDASRVVDYLRATVVVATMPEVCRVWEKLKELKTQGTIEIVCVENGFRCVVSLVMVLVLVLVLVLVAAAAAPTIHHRVAHHHVSLMRMFSYSADACHHTTGPLHPQQATVILI